MPNNFEKNQNFPVLRREQFAESFRLWEIRGRGWQIFDCETQLEPVFSRFIPPRKAVNPTDDGRMPTLFGRLFSNINNAKLLSGDANLPSESSENLRSPINSYEKTFSYRIHLPNELKFLSEQTEQLLLNLASSASFIGFEIIGTSQEVFLQIACPETQKSAVFSLLKNHLPTADSRDSENAIRENLFPNRTNESIVIDFGLRREWFIPLPSGKSFATDALLPLIAAMEELAEGETLCLQVLFCRVRGNWQQAVRETIFDQAGKPVFANLNNYLAGIKEKLSNPLLAASVRLAARSDSKEKSLWLARQTSAFFRQFSAPDGNELIPLKCDELPEESHLQSFLNRTSHRNGMLLSARELAAIVHLPSDAVKSAKLRRDENLTKPAPEFASKGNVILGENIHRGKSMLVKLSPEQFKRHIFIGGGSGGGKSTILCNLASQIIEQEGNCCVIDSAGDLIDDVMTRIPERRIRDTIVLDVSDSDYPVGFNPLEAHSDAEKYLLSSDLVSLFRRYSSAWGSIMEAATAHAVNAFLFNSRVGNLLDLKRFLIEKDFRRDILQTVEDDSVRYFWEHEASGINAKSLSSVLIRLDAFLRHPLIRNIVCQKQSKLNFREILDGKILLVKISQGLIGQENAALIGTLLSNKLYQIALSRQDTEIEKRKSFMIFADEIQNYQSPSLGLCLASTRKYAVSFALATQSLRILDTEIAESILTNCYTRICFRLGDEDARRFAQGFSSFTAEDLQRLSIGQSIARIDRADFDFRLKTFPLSEISPETAEKRKKAVIEYTRKTYATPKAEVEAEILSRQQTANNPLIETPFKHKSQSPLIKAVKVSQGQDERTSQTNVESNDFDNSAKHNQGRGGQHHQELQAVIRRMAESYGFRVEIEKGVLGGAGSVDVSLERENLKIACEVSVTSTTDYETKNILKCLAAGYDYAIVAVSNQKKLPALNTRLYSAVPLEQQEKVKALSLTGLLTFLRELTVPEETTQKKRERKSGQRLTLVEASEFLGISRSVIYRLIRQGAIPFYRIGREYRFDREELRLIGKHDLLGKRTASVKLSPLKIERSVPKSKKEQDARYRKLLKLD
jgi:excisionase family DNA binding protein